MYIVDIVHILLLLDINTQIIVLRTEEGCLVFWLVFSVLKHFFKTVSNFSIHSLIKPEDSFWEQFGIVIHKRLSSSAYFIRQIR